MTTQNPFIHSSAKMPEITLRGLILALFLIVTLTAANAYLGLKLGTTISASIPAAIAAMGILGLFKNSNVLENNIVQTAASAGESVISGVAFILPAMLITHCWTQFNYWETVYICMIGGIIGVIVSIPLRRILLTDTHLRFPEATAIGHVLIAGSSEKSGLKYLVGGALVGGLISLAQAGFKIFKDTIMLWYGTSQQVVYGCAIGFDPALLAAGYIVGESVAVSTLVGVIIGWGVGIPLLSHLHHGEALGSTPTDIAYTLWNHYIRYIGLGTMLVGGLWILLNLFKPLWHACKASIDSLKTFRQAGKHQIDRLEQDIPLHFSALCMLLVSIPLCFLIFHYANAPQLGLSLSLKIVTMVVVTLFVLIVGFILSALSGYFSGLIGYTNSPGSALILISVIMIAFITLALFGLEIHFNSQQVLYAEAFVILVACIIATLNSLTGETIQDLKVGQIVGTTPWKQQVMLILGVIVSSFIIPWIFQLLFDAYGMGGVFPRPGMNPSEMLSAPQAALASALVQATFNHQLPWDMMTIGGVIAVVGLIIDHKLRERNMSLPVLAIGLGIYLPVEVSAPMILGGLMHLVIGKIAQSKISDVTLLKERKQRGLILACGIVAGAALMGVLLAIPFTISHSTEILKLVGDNFDFYASLLSFVSLFGLMFWFYWVVAGGIKLLIKA